MNGHPEMPDPRAELMPRQLVAAIEEWAAGHGYSTEQSDAGGEYARVVVRDPADGSTYTTIPNAHKGRRLRRDQVRYAVRHLNQNWRA